MNYSKLYNQLIENAKFQGRNKEQDYFEEHHIIPRCIDGGDSLDNLVLLTAREHYVAHWLLTKIHRNYKLASAFNNMCQKGIGQKRNFTSKQYEITKKYFSKYHPCKEPEIRNKISESLKQYYLNNPNATDYKKRKEVRECACGCGKVFECRPSDVRKYFDNTHIIKSSEEIRKKQSDSVKKYLSDLTEEELSKRQKNSFGSCDHKERGVSISKGKRGKKTNQQEIMGKRYASMADSEFNDFIKDKNLGMKNRLTNLRAKYLNV